MFVVSRTLPLSYCLPSVLISQPLFSHHKEIMLLDPLPWLICHPAAPLLQRRTAGAEKRKQYQQAGGHNIKCSSFTGPESLVSSLFFQELHKVNMLFLLCATPPNFQEADKLQPLFSLHLNVLLCITLYPAHCISLHVHSIIPAPSFTITRYSKKYCQCSQFAVTSSVTSL